ncbi:MAG: amidohydrolase family protein [Chloroflexota bacterium]
MSEMMISADDHIDLGYLPGDLWTERLPRRLQERGPHVEERDGRELWICDGKVWSEWRLGHWFTDSWRHRVALDRVPFDGNPSLRPTTPHLRIEDMARDGVEASVLFPPIFGMRTMDRELAEAMVCAYNDWSAEFTRAAPKQLICVAQLFPDDAEASTREVRRAAEMGLKQVNFLVGTVTPEMYQEAWDPFWATAEEAGIIVSYHAGGVSKTGTFEPDRGPKLARAPMISMGLSNGATQFYDPFVGLFAYGILERHPNLKFILGESGTGWVPFVVQEMDYRFHRALETTSREDFPLKRLPSEIFREQVWATYQQDRVGLALTNFFGEGHMMWASDYPHPDSTWPDSQAIVAKETVGLDPRVKQGILRDNAKALYGI